MVERRDQGLNHAERAVESARIAPGFEVMGFSNVPVAKFRSFVKMRGDVDGVLDGLAFFLFVEFDLGCEVEIVRRGVDRINA